MPTVRVETVKGDIYEVKHVFSLAQVREQLAKVYKTQAPSLRFFYSGHEITNATANMEAMSEKGNLFVLRSQTHDVDVLLSALKLHIKKMCEVYRVEHANFVRFQKRSITRGDREMYAINQLKEQIRAKVQLKIAFASRRQFLEADDMKRAVEVLQEKLRGLEEKVEEQRRLALEDRKSSEVQSFVELREDVMNKLKQCHIVVIGFFEKLQGVDNEAIDRLTSRIQVLEMDNAAKVQNAMKNLAKEIVEAEQEMDTLAAQEEYRAANESKLRLAYLHKQVKVMADYRFKDALVIYAKRYSSEKTAAEAPAGVNLNVHGEFEIYLTYEKVLNILGKRVAVSETEGGTIVETLATLTSLITSLPMPGTADNAEHVTNVKMLLQRILNTSVLLSAKAATKRSARNEHVLRLKDRAPESPGSKASPRSRANRSLKSSSPVTKSTRRTLQRMAIMNNRSDAKSNDLDELSEMEMSESIANIEKEFEGITGSFAASPAASPRFSRAP